jgi:AcrR family transcriptional regulator
MSRASTPAGDAVGSDSRATLDPGATEAAAVVPPKPVTRVGRPRDSSVHARILASAAALVVRDGYARVTIEGIAAHAGVGKATIYRRWASKGTLVLEAIASIFSIGAPNTGDVRADLIAHVREIGDTVTNSIYGAAIPGLHADLARDPELGEDFRRICVSPTRQASIAAIERAVAAGSLPADVDFDMLADLFGSLIFFRTLVLGAPIEADFAEKLIRLIVDGEIPRASVPGRTVPGSEPADE